MEEGLVIDKPNPGLQVFDSAKCLQYFSKETIFAKYLGSSTTEQWSDTLLYSQVYHLVNEPEALFYLMSLCLEKQVVDVCRRCSRDSNQFQVSLFNVIHVFLNWGATLESLGIQDDLQLSMPLKPTLPPILMPDFPAHYNIEAVLDEVSQSLLMGEGEDAVKQRYIIVRALMIASLDERLRPHRYNFLQTIHDVLETFQIWNIEKVLTLGGQLPSKILLQNAAYLFCSLFVTSPRLRDLKVIGVRSLLHSRFNLPSPTESLESFLQSLPPPEQIMERFRLVEIYVLFQLLNTLLTTCNLRPPQVWADCVVNDVISKASIGSLLKWTEAVHSKLMDNTTFFVIEGGIVREKCVRLRADCKELLKDND